MATTRKRLRIETSQPSSEMLDMRTVIQEIRQLREEQTRRDMESAALLRQRDEELQRIREELRAYQISLSDNGNLRNSRVSGDRVMNAIENVSGSRREVTNEYRGELGFKLKPDTFDGGVPLREFMSQFNLIAKASHWGERTKAIALASCLRGKARSVLECVEDPDNLEFSELKSKLELRFGDSYLSQTYYSQFTCRKQKFGENLAALGSDIERLSRLAYPECSYAVRDKIACAQFISAIANEFVKRTLKLEKGVISLKTAIERAKAIKVIYGENSGSRAENSYKRSEETGNDKKNNNDGNGKNNNDDNGEKNGFKEKEKGSRKSESQKKSFFERVLAVRESGTSSFGVSGKLEET